MSMHCGSSHYSSDSHSVLLFQCPVTYLSHAHLGWLHLVSTGRNSDPEAVTATEKKMNTKITRDWFTSYQTKRPLQAPTTEVAPNNSVTILCLNSLLVYCMSFLLGGKTQCDHATVEWYTLWHLLPQWNGIHCDTFCHSGMVYIVTSSATVEWYKLWHLLPQWNGIHCDIFCHSGMVYIVTSSATVEWYTLWHLLPQWNGINCDIFCHSSPRFTNITNPGLYLAEDQRFQ
jgi:hypothetical protein